MKILAISDIHGYVDLLRNVLEREIDVEIIIFSGDIAPYRLPQKTLNYLLKAIDIAKMYKINFFISVPGNIDIPNHYGEIQDKIYVNIHNSYKLYKDYIFLGFGGSPITPFATSFELSDDVMEKNLMQLYNMVKTIESKDHRYIVVTHSPPYGTKCDIAYNGINIGSKAVRKIIDLMKPMLIICGHVHESRCVDKIGDTVIVNPGPLFKGFYTIININDRDIKVFQHNL